MVGNIDELIKSIVKFPKNATNKEKEDIIKELINRRRRQVLTHSIIYYRLNNNIIGDKTWDLWARQLVALQTRYPKTSKKVKPLYDEFKDFDASTGFHLCNLTCEEGINAAELALNLINYHKQQEEISCNSCYVNTLNDKIKNVYSIKVR